MNNKNYPIARKIPARQSLYAAILIAVAGAIAPAPALSQTSEAPQSYAIPAGDLGDALDQLASQGGLQIAYPGDLVRGKSATALSGRQTWREALQKLLTGTGLTWKMVNATTVVIVPIPSNAAPVPGGQPTTQNEGEEKKELAEPEPVELAPMIVTGSRIHHAGPSEFAVSPVTVFDREQIERSGAVNIADFLGRITQAEHSVLDREGNGSLQSARPTINLRGLGTGATLILLNGRRLPQTGRGVSVNFATPNDAVNLAHIPLNAIERIEVLTDSASAVYGSDAIGGVVNIITRGDYSGLEVSGQYGRTSRADAEERQFGVLWGASGKTASDRQYSATLSLDLYDFDGLRASERPFTSQSDYFSSGGRPPRPVNRFVPNARAGTVASLGPFPLPGLSTSFVAIPEGQDGRSLTLADFDESAPIESAEVDLPRYHIIMPLEERQSLSFSGELDLSPGLVWFTNASYSRNELYYELEPPSATMTVPATNPFNPFGVDVLVTKVFYELGPSWRRATTDLATLTTGLRGKWLDHWRYELSADHVRTVEKTHALPGTLRFDPFPVDVFDPDSPYITPIGYYLLHETDPATALNVFGDGRTTSPNADALLRQLVTILKYSEASENTGLTFNTDGRVLDLPAGPVRASIGGEVRRQQLNIHQNHDAGVSYNSLEDGYTQDFVALYGEAVVPLLGPASGAPFTRSLELSLAGRADYETVFRDTVLTPRVGLLWHPTDSLALRTSYSQGYKTPGLQVMYSRGFEASSYINAVDPVTGDTVGIVNVRQGGNPDLDPEESESWNVGFVYKPARLKGASLSIDWFDIDYKNRVVGPFVNPETLVLFNPERLTRDPITNAITDIDARSMNIGANRVRGVDLRARQSFETDHYGAFDVAVNATYNIHNKEIANSGVEAIDLVGITIPRLRANASLFWARGPFEVGGTASYISARRNLAYEDFGYLPKQIDESYNLDMQASLDLGELVRSKPLFWGWRLTFGVNNVFDTLPPSTNGDGGYANLDPRMRRFYISFRKSL